MFIIPDVDADHHHHAGPELLGGIYNLDSDGNPLGHFSEVSGGTAFRDQRKFRSSRSANADDFAGKLCFWIGIDFEIDKLPRSDMFDLCLLQIRFQPDIV